MKRYLCLSLALLTALTILLTGCGVKRGDLPAAETTSAAALTAAPTDAAQTSAVPATEPTQTTAETTTAAPGSRRLGQAPEGYFEEMLFIGDSRTEDLLNYNALTTPTIFSRVSTSLYNLHSEPAPVNHGIGEIDFVDLINNYQFKHIYIMLGFNEIGYARQQTVNKFEALIEEVRAAQPGADIIIQANLHVTPAYAARHPDESNEEIDDFNSKIAQFADGETIFYIDMNELFDDANGALDTQYTGDGVHLTPSATKEWADWLATKAVV